MSIQIRGKRGKRKWTENKQHGPSLARTLLRTNSLEKGIDHGSQGGLTPSCFSVCL